MRFGPDNRTDNFVDLIDTIRPVRNDITQVIADLGLTTDFPATLLAERHRVAFGDIYIRLERPILTAKTSSRFSRLRLVPS